MLDAMRTRRFRDGGYVGGSVRHGAGGSERPGLDYDRLGAAVAKHMPRPQEFPRKLTLDAGGKTFDAHVRGIARDEVDQQAEFDRRHG